MQKAQKNLYSEKQSQNLELTKAFSITEETIFREEKSWVIQTRGHESQAVFQKKYSNVESFYFSFLHILLDEKNNIHPLWHKNMYCHRTLDHCCFFFFFLKEVGPRLTFDQHWNW